MKKNNKKKIIIVIGVLLFFIAASTTIAWLTKTSKLINTFTVGTFSIPTTSPTDPAQTIDIEGNLYEPSWNEQEEHKLMPGVSFAKDPYVGIGKNSEDAVVYIYVENNFTNKIYFTINEGWEAVEANAGYLPNTYTSGLFKYTSTLAGSKEKDVWTTTSLFSEVIADDTTEISDLTVAENKEEEIVVSSFIHQANDDQNNPIDDSIILEAAKKNFNLN